MFLTQVLATLPVDYPGNVTLDASFAMASIGCIKGSERGPPMPTEQQRLDSVIGEMAAIQCAVLALITTHPDPEALREHLEDVLTKGLARLEPTSAPDEAISGFQLAAKSFRAAAKLPSE